MNLRIEHINQTEVLRYLGHRGQAIPESIERLITQCAAEVLQVAQPKYVAQTYPVTPLREHKEIQLVGTDLVLYGTGVWEHLAEATQATLFAATLGAGIDQLLRRTELLDMTKAVILDAVATQYIEQVCDTIEVGMEAELAAKGLTKNWRYSPGYGDLPLEIQPRFLNLLDSYRKIGLSCTPNWIMIPRKSVSAFFGIFETPPKTKRKKSCSTCMLQEHCELRKAGTHCANR